MSVTIVARPSGASLYLRVLKYGEVKGNATGFLVEHDGEGFLVTNQHVVLGKGLLPDVLSILHNKIGALGAYEEKAELLYDKDGEPLWFVHPMFGFGADVAVLPLTRTDGIEVLSYDPWVSGPGLRAGVSDALNIIGFPFGVTGGAAFGVWTRGFVASEPDIDWQGLPVFLVDSRTREGQSGSPVIAYSPAGPTAMEDGSLSFSGGPLEQFFGVYSGRINRESDLGIVWKSRVVREIIEARQRATKEAVMAKKNDYDDFKEAEDLGGQLGVSEFSSFEVLTKKLLSPDA